LQLQGAINYPVALSNPAKLVYSPHVYGHGNHPYMRAADFPHNMPAIWWHHFARVPSATGVPIVLGEWGGSMPLRSTAFPAVRPF
jgi:endoglucanase